LSRIHPSRNVNPNPEVDVWLDVTFNQPTTQRVTQRVDQRVSLTVGSPRHDLITLNQSVTAGISVR
jgi:hypothetical protein